MSLLSAIENRTPLVWVNTIEPERLIANIPSICSDRDLFIHDPFRGLLQWSTETNDWKVVLVTIPPAEPEDDEVQVALYDLRSALGYVFRQKNAIYMMRNAHKDVEDSLSLFSVLYGQYRSTFWSNDLDKLPLQIISLSAGDPPPPEIAAMATVVDYGLPGDAEFASILSHINEHHETDILAGQDVNKVITSSRGMTELEAIETYFKSVRTSGVVDEEYVNKLKIDRLKAASILDIIRPTIDLSSVGGLDNAKNLIYQADWIWRNAKEAKTFGLTPLRRVLFLGLPGTGKSMICEAAAKTFGIDLARTGVGKVMNRFVGQSERNMEATFQQINALAPIAVWIDELGRDLSGGGSSDIVDGGTTSRVHATFLTGLQELADNVFLFAAANDISSLAPEMLRADRFDKIMFVGFPSFEERREIFKLNLTTEIDYDLDQLSDLTPCFTGAEIKSLIKEVKFRVSPIEKRQINTKDIVNVIPNQKNRLWTRHRGFIIDMYKRAHNEHEWASTVQHREAGHIISGKEPSRNQQRVATTLK